MSTDDLGPEQTSSPEVIREFLRDLERTLRLGVIVQSIEVGPPVTIRALLLLGQHSEHVVGAGTTEAEAWRDLARSAIAWRTTNDKHVPWWGGGG